MGSTVGAACALTAFEQSRYAREVLRAEAMALWGLAERLPHQELCAAVELIQECSGRLVVSGMGKAGLIGRKIAATFASTGTASHFLHPAEAMHGDLGCIRRDDVILMLSYSGETEEIVRLLPSLGALGVPLIALTGRPDSSLGRAATVVLDLGRLDEACFLGLAPSTSTTAMLGLGDALALVVSRGRGFAPQDFVRFHPGGSLGRKLTKVDEVMRPLVECRLASQSQSVREVLVRQSRPGRRTGAIMLTDADGVLRGIFTDSDLARLVAESRDGEFDCRIELVMTRQPKVVVAGAGLDEALQILERHKISELPVIDAAGRPVGLIDVTDLIGVPSCQCSGGRDAGEQPTTVSFTAARGRPAT